MGPTIWKSAGPREAYSLRADPGRGGKDLRVGPADLRAGVNHDDTFLTAKAVGDLLSISPSTAYRLPITKYQISKRAVRWLRADVMAYVNSRRQAPARTSAKAFSLLTPSRPRSNGHAGENAFAKGQRVATEYTLRRAKEEDEV